MAQPKANYTPPGTDDTTVSRVVAYAVFNWMSRHMSFECRADALDPVPQFLWQFVPPSLQFQSTEVILGRHYTLELTKEPLVYLIKELTVEWLPQLDGNERRAVFRSIVTDRCVDHPSGFYRVVTEASEDQEYLVKLKINRI